MLDQLLYSKVKRSHSLYANTVTVKPLWPLDKPLSSSVVNHWLSQLGGYVNVVKLVSVSIS